MAGVETLLMFGDSSGNPSRAIGGFAASSRFIAGTITLDADGAHRVDESVLAIKRRYFSRADPVRVEFHGSALRKKLNLHTGNRARAERMLHDILDDLLGVMADSGASVNMVIMDKVAPVEASGHVGVLSGSWGHAANMFRQSLLRARVETVGIPILDRYDDASNRTVSRAVAKSLSQLRLLVKSTSSRAIPYPIFVDSRSSNMIQLVDIGTYIVAKRVEGSDDAEFADRYRQLLPSIDRTINISVRAA